MCRHLRSSARLRADDADGGRRHPCRQLGSRVMRAVTDVRPSDGQQVLVLAIGSGHGRRWRGTAGLAVGAASIVGAHGRFIGGATIGSTAIGSTAIGSTTISASASNTVNMTRVRNWRHRRASGWVRIPDHLPDSRSQLAAHADHQRANGRRAGSPNRRPRRFAPVLWRAVAAPSARRDIGRLLFELSNDYTPRAHIPVGNRATLWRRVAASTAAVV